jgi:hypothetical protein
MGLFAQSEDDKRHVIKILAEEHNIYKRRGGNMCVCVFVSCVCLFV